MTERDKLIEILKNDSCQSPMLCDPNCKYAKLERCYEERTADYLLENGVLMLPVKIGDTVYILDKLVNVIEGEVVKIEYTCEAENYSKFIREKFLVLFTSSATQYDFYDIGKFVFLTKEEAEKALAERSNIE